MAGLPSDYNHIAITLHRRGRHLFELSAFADGRNVTFITRVCDPCHFRKRKFEPHSHVRIDQWRMRAPVASESFRVATGVQ